MSNLWEIKKPSALVKSGKRVEPLHMYRDRGGRSMRTPARWKEGRSAPIPNELPVLCVAFAAGLAVPQLGRS